MTSQTIYAHILTVILAHPDSVVRTAVAAALEQSAGWRIHAVPNGGDAVQAALVMLPQLVLIDPYLQGMDGIATVAALRAHGISSPIVALVERDEHVQRSWDSLGFAGAVTLANGIAHLLPQLQIVLKHYSRGQGSGAKVEGSDGIGMRSDVRKLDQ